MGYTGRMDTNPHVIARKEALDRGLEYYFTGKPCAKGHSAKRRTLTGYCVVCRPPRKIKQSDLSRGQQTYRGNREYYIGKAAIRKQKTRGNLPNLTENELNRIMQLHELRAELQVKHNRRLEIDHILPLKHGGMHHPDNLRVVTYEYNRAKKDKLNYPPPSDGFDIRV